MTPDPEFPPDVPVPKTMLEAVRALRDPAYLASENWQRQQWRAVRLGAHPDLLEFERLFVKRMAKRLEVPLYAHNMVRSFDDQNALFAEGKSLAKGGQSAHNYGLGVDIVHAVRHWNLSKDEWAVLGHVGKEVASSNGFEVVWGGDWPNFYDPAHWEITGWKRLHGDFPFSPKGD